MKLTRWDNAADTYRALVNQKKGDATTHLNLGISLYNVSLGSRVKRKSMRRIRDSPKPSSLCAKQLR